MISEKNDTLSVHLKNEKRKIFSLFGLRVFSSFLLLFFRFFCPYILFKAKVPLKNQSIHKPDKNI